ncbi:MAG: AtpZ/AtpI family protein [Nannocystis sp.]|nr:AtpZ/AtpI family protein [Nannocystis sp.]
MSEAAPPPRPERPPPSGASDQSSARLTRKISLAHQRRERARREPVGSLWAHVARVGTLGWLIVTPIALGALVGHLIDRAYGTGVTWALALLTLGLCAAGYFYWKVIQEERP